MFKQWGILFTLCAFSVMIVGCVPKQIQLESVSSEKIPDVPKLEAVTAMIIEIEEVKGEQKFIYIKLGKDNEWYEEGQIGFIFNDVEKKKKIGKFKVIEIFDKFSKGEVLELSYKIDPKGVVEIEVDPRFLTK